MKVFSLNTKFKPFYKIANAKQGRRFAIGDIHGHYDIFIELLNKISLSKNDQLFLLGDYLDRGDKVPELLNKIIAMIKAGYAIFPLRGNHEDMCWQAHQKDYDEESLKLPGYKWGKTIIDSNRKIFPSYVDFISKLPYYYELDNFYLVHAGFDFSHSTPFLDYKTMLWVCNTEDDVMYLNGKTIIHGHSKRTIEFIRNSVKNKSQIIGLDNSVYITNNPDYGSLVCLDLDSCELFVQQRI